jgi:hypothetical protein
VEDQHHHDELCRFLEGLGYGFWSFSKSKRKYDTHLFTEIEDRIINSALILIIVSNSWKRSKWAYREFHFVDELEKPFFLLRFAPMEPTLAIAGILQIDLSAGQQAGLNTLRQELAEHGL